MNKLIAAAIGLACVAAPAGCASAADGATAPTGAASTATPGNAPHTALTRARRVS